MEPSGWRTATTSTAPDRCGNGVSSPSITDVGRFIRCSLIDPGVAGGVRAPASGPSPSPAAAGRASWWTSGSSRYEAAPSPAPDAWEPPPSLRARPAPPGAAPASAGPGPGPGPGPAPPPASSAIPGLRGRAFATVTRRRSAAGLRHHHHHHIAVGE